MPAGDKSVAFWDKIDAHGAVAAGHTQAGLFVIVFLVVPDQSRLAKLPIWKQKLGNHRTVSLKQNCPATPAMCTPSATADCSLMSRSSGWASLPKATTEIGSRATEARSLNSLEDFDESATPD
jgi:hypothetical protein